MSQMEIVRSEERVEALISGSLLRLLVTFAVDEKLVGSEKPDRWVRAAAAPNHRTSLNPFRSWVPPVDSEWLNVWLFSVSPVCLGVSFTIPFVPSHKQTKTAMLSTNKFPAIEMRSQQAGVGRSYDKQQTCAFKKVVPSFHFLRNRVLAELSTALLGDMWQLCLCSAVRGSLFLTGWMMAQSPRGRSLSDTGLFTTDLINIERPMWVDFFHLGLDNVHGMFSTSWLHSSRVNTKCSVYKLRKRLRPPHDQTRHLLHQDEIWI